MSGSPKYKIFSPDGEYIGCVKDLEDAAMLAAFRGNGSQVRDGHSKRDTIWTDGAEEMPEGAGWDTAAAIMQARIDARYAKSKVATVLAVRKLKKQRLTAMEGKHHDALPRYTRKGRKKFLRLTDEEIQRFDKALIANTEHLYDLKG